MILACKRLRLTRRSCTRGLKTRTHQHEEGVDVLNPLSCGIRSLRFSNASASAGGGARLITNPTCLRVCKEFASAPPGEQVLHAGAFLVADRARRSDQVQSQARRLGGRQARRRSRRGRARRRRRRGRTTTEFQIKDVDVGSFKFKIMNDCTN